MVVLIDGRELFELIYEFDTVYEQNTDADTLISKAFSCIDDRFTAEAEIEQCLSEILEYNPTPLDLETSHKLRLFESVAYTMLGLFVLMNLYRHGKLPYVIGRRFGSSLALVRKDVYAKSLNQDEQQNTHLYSGKGSNRGLPRRVPGR